MEEFKVSQLYMQTLHGGVSAKLSNRQKPWVTQKHWVTKLRSLMKSEARLQTLQVSNESSEGSAHNCITPIPNKIHWAIYRHWCRFHRATSNSIKIWTGSDKQCVSRTVYLCKHKSRSLRSVQMVRDNSKTFESTKTCCRHWEKTRISLIISAT